MTNLVLSSLKDLPTGNYITTPGDRVGSKTLVPRNVKTAGPCGICTGCSEFNSLKVRTPLCSATDCVAAGAIWVEEKPIQVASVQVSEAVTETAEVWSRKRREYVKLVRLENGTQCGDYIDQARGYCDEEWLNIHAHSNKKEFVLQLRLDLENEPTYCEDYFILPVSLIDAFLVVSFDAILSLTGEVTLEAQLRLLKNMSVTDNGVISLDGKSHDFSVRRIHDTLLVFHKCKTEDGKMSYDFHSVSHFGGIYFMFEQLTADSPLREITAVA